MSSINANYASGPVSPSPLVLPSNSFAVNASTSNHSMQLKSPSRAAAASITKLKRSRPSLSSFHLKQSLLKESESAPHLHYFLKNHEQFQDEELTNSTHLEQYRKRSNITVRKNLRADSEAFLPFINERDHLGNLIESHVRHPLRQMSVPSILQTSKRLRTVQRNASDPKIDLGVRVKETLQ